MASTILAKPTIYILTTGGTIGGISDSPLNANYTSASFDINKTIQNMPELNDIALLKSEEVASVGSQAMNNEIMINLADKVNKLLVKNDVNGVVITHGTDTMEESAYFLNLVVKSKKPIVFTGAMRTQNSKSSDAELNLFNAINVAANPQSREKGAIVVINDEIHAAREVSKTNTTALNSFSSPNSGKIGTVHYGKVNFYLSPIRKHTTDSIFNIKDIKELPKVDILYSHSDDNAEFVKSAVSNGAKGIIVAGMGNGNLYPSVEKELDNASKNGIIIVRSSRTGSGNTSVGGEVKNENFITSDNLNPQKARILLMLALNKTDDKAKIQEFFNTHWYLKICKFVNLRFY